MLKTYLDPIMGKVELLGALVEEGKVYLYFESEQKEVLKMLSSQFQEYAIRHGITF